MAKHRKAKSTTHAGPCTATIEAQRPAKRTSTAYADRREYLFSKHASTCSCQVFFRCVDGLVVPTCQRPHSGLVTHVVSYKELAFTN
jgi:hypothetical protein